MLLECHSHGIVATKTSELTVDDVPSTSTTDNVTGSNSTETRDVITEPKTDTATTDTVTGSNFSEGTTPNAAIAPHDNTNTDTGIYSDSTVDYEYPEELVKNDKSTVNSPESTHSDGEHTKSEGDDEGEPELVIRRKRQRKRVKYIKSSESDHDSDESFHKRPKRRKLDSKRYPSEARIQAQKGPTKQPKYTLRSTIGSRGDSKLKHAKPTPSSEEDKHSADDVNNDSGYVPSPSNATENDSVHTNQNTDGDTRSSITSTDSNSSSSTSTSTKTKTPKGEWNTTTRGVRRYKRKRKFKCPSCEQVENSVAKMNTHYRTTHDPLSCQTCQRLFNTPSALRKHSYIHTNNPHRCNKCPKSFAFASQLASHKISHRSVGTYQCMKCQTYCKNKSDLTKHVRVHDGKLHVCKICNDYESPDIRNLRAHKISKHTKIKRYACEYCTEKFHHFNQRSRHYKKCSKKP